MCGECAKRGGEGGWEGAGVCAGARYGSLVYKKFLNQNNRKVSTVKRGERGGGGEGRKMGLGGGGKGDWEKVLVVT